MGMVATLDVVVQSKNPPPSDADEPALKAHFEAIKNNAEAVYTAVVQRKLGFTMLFLTVLKEIERMAESNEAKYTPVP